MPTDPNELFQEASCLGCNSNASLADMLKLALLDRISSGGGGGGTPGGADTQVQYNDGGVFGGSAGFTFNDATNALTITGNFTFNQTLEATVVGTAFLVSSGGGANPIQLSGSPVVIGGGSFALNSNGRSVGWRNGTLTLFDVDADTLLLSTDNTAANARDLIVRTLTTAPGFTVGGTLPAAGNVGRRAYVTNALAPAFMAIVAGGGVVVTPVFDDGTNWICA